MEAADPGRVRTGTFWSAFCHAFTAEVGSGILAVPWSVAQLGWIAGPIVLILFAVITFFTANLLTNCYRSPTGKRNDTYLKAVKCFLGVKDVIICGCFQYSLLWGCMVGYTVTTAMSIAAVKKSVYFKEGSIGTRCVSVNTYMMIYGGVQTVLSQLPNLEKVTFLSVAAAATSVIYSVVSLGLTVGQFAMHPAFRGSYKLGSPDIGNNVASRIWHVLQSLGNVAFAYTYSMLLLEIQDTLKSPPPEDETMRRVSVLAIGGTTLFYISLGCMGYAAFGSDTPGNILVGSYKPSWAIDIGNLAVIIHLMAAYQVFAQPLFNVLETWLSAKWPTSPFFNKGWTMNISKSYSIRFSLCRLVVGPTIVVLTTMVSMAIPFFNAIVGLLGSLAFWPLAIHFPVKMYMAQAKTLRGSLTWILLWTLDWGCLALTLGSASGSIADIVDKLKHAKLFGRA